jgi:hypothetical protein
MKTGAIHQPTPAAVANLATRARLDLMLAPTACDWFAKCPADGNMLGNDTHGNCVEVTDFRIIQVRRANAWRDTWAPTTNMCLDRYAALTGFDPATGLPDNGTDTTIDMTNWCTKGIRLDTQNVDVPHWCTVDPHNVQHVNLAIAHTGPVAVTFNLPIGAQSLDWSKAPGTSADWKAGSWGAHRIPAGKYDGSERTIRTWGRDLLVHPDFWDAYCLAVDVTVSREWLSATGLAPSGLDFDALEQDVLRLTM